MGVRGHGLGRGIVTEYPLPGSIGIGHSRSEESRELHAPVAITMRSACRVPFEVASCTTRLFDFSKRCKWQCSMKFTPRSLSRCDQLALSRSGRIDVSFG